jgi:2',3'-cyclic-nucleotide 2'-phosphodiesterase (5'-nucleotidase family)
VLVHSGAFAKFVGRLDLVVHVGTDNSQAATRSRVTSFAYINLPIDSQADLSGNPKIPDDPDVSALLWPYSVKINQDIDLNGVFAYVDPTLATAKILRADATGGDSQLGNLVARSMQLQEGVEAEFALTNSLGIRADFERGPLTNEQMFNVFPFENSIVVMYLSGQEVQDTLDFVARKSASRGCRGQAQVAGITFDMVCQGTCTSIDPGTGLPSTACAKNIYLGDNCRGFVKNPDGTPKLDTLNNPIPNSNGPVDPSLCAALDLTGLYRVAVNDYIAAGGSGFDVLKRNSSKQNTGISLRDGLTVFLNKQTVCDTSVLDFADTVHSPQQTVIQNYGKISCLNEDVEAHDGRIRPVFE